MNFLKHTIGLTYVALVCVFLLLPKVVFGVDISTVYESIQTKKIINTVYQKPVFNLDRLKVSPRVSAAQKASISDAVKSAYSKLINFGSKAFEPIYVEQSTPVLNTPAQKVITTKANTPSVVSNPKNQVVPVNSNNVLAVQLSELRKRINDLEKKGNVVVQPITQNVYNSYVTSGYSYSQPSRDAVSTQQVTVDIESAIAPLREQIANISSGTSTISTGSVSTSTIRSMFSSSASGLGYDSASGIFSLVSGYVIPTTASTTEWMTAYTNRITSASGPLSIASNSISISKASSTADGYLSSTDWNTFNNKVSSQWTTSGSNVYYTTGNVGVGTTTPDSKLSVAGDINLTGALRFNGSAGTSGYILQSTGTGAQWVATSSLGITGGGDPFSTSSVRSVLSASGPLVYNQSTGAFTFSTSTLSTSDIIEGSNLYFTNVRADARIAQATSTIRSMFSSSASGLGYDSASGIFSLVSGYVIPTTASTTEWQASFASTTNMSAFWSTPSTRITAGTGLSWSGNTLNNTGVTSIGNLTGDIATSSLRISTTDVIEGVNLFFTNARADGRIALASSTIRAMISSTASGLSYDNTTGVLSLAADRSIPLTASTTEWMTAYTNRITSASGPLNLSANTLSLNQAGGSTDGYLSSTDWNTFNNKVSSQWTTSGSNVYYTTGNVGVGTTTPTAKLAITGNGATTGRAFVIANSANSDRFVVTDSGDVNMGLNLTSTVSGSFNIISQSGNIIIQPGAGEATHFYQGGIRLSDGTQGLNRPAANELGILANGSERIRVSSNGNVGIATTTPGYSLTVGGDINLAGALRFNGSAGTSGYILQSTGTGAQWVATSTLGLSGGSGSQWNSSGSDINFMTGNVGIGTTTPSAKLTIVGDGYLSGTLTAGLLNITGTGTSTINSNIVMSGDIIPSTDITYTLGTPQKQWKDVYIGPGSLYINGQKVLQEESQSIVVTADLNQNLVMRTAGTGDIELNPSGTGLVQLKGNVQLSAGYDISTSNNSAVSFSDGIRPGNISLSANKIITTNTNGSLELSATGTGAIYTGIGNFGIGTTTPGYALTVAGDTNITGALRFNGSAGTSGMVLQSTGTGAQWVATSTLGLGGGSSQWTTTGSDIYYTTGNVGIGVTSPQDKLAVSGNIYASLGLSVGGGSATTTGTRTAISPGLLVGYSGTEATGRWRLGNAGITNGVGGLVFDSGLGGLSGGGGGGIGQSVLRTVSLYTGDGSTLVERLRVDGSGNVGIGTTTAASRLSVAGDINFTGALKTNGDAGTSGYILQSTGTGAQWVATSSLGITGGGGGSSQWTTTGSDIYYTTGNVGVGTTTPGSKLAITGTAGSTNDLLIVATSTNARYFTITSTGNVGIGSTTPAAALHITRANSANEVEYMRFSSSNAATAGDEFSSYWYSGNSTTKLAKMSVVNEGSSKAGFRFGVTNDGGATTPNRLVISGDGNVGIGNNVTPQALLHLARTNTTSGAEWELMRYSLTGSSFTGDELSTYWYTQGSTHKLAKMSVINEGGGKAGFRFGTTNDGAVTTPNRVAITGDGRLGVGLVNPQTALEVVGSASTTALYIPATQSATIGTLNLGGSRFLHAYTAASVFVGPNAGNFTSTGSYNTGVGSLALTAVTSGHSNVGIGPSALAGVTIGVRNVGIGYLAIGSGTNGGNDNIAIGYGALGATSVTGSNNTVVGNANAARAIGSGSGNTLYGYGVGYSTSGSYNNFFGFQSGYGVTTGSRNILLGASTLVASYNQITTGSNNISIGNDVAVASTTASNQLNIGNLIYGTNLNGTGSTVSTGNIGIGTTTPWAKLTVAGEVNSTFFSAASTTATSTFAGGLNVGGGALIHDWNTGVTTIANASLGAATFESDSGIISWIDMPVTSDASNGTVQSYSAQLDGTPVLTVYGTSNGSGGVSNLRVGIGTSTPSSALTVNGEAYTYSSSANIGFSAEYTGASGRKYSLLSCYNCGSAGLGGFEVYDSTAAATRAYIQAGVNGWQTPSDRRLKDDIRTLNVLDKIDSIRGASYVLKDSNIPQIGVIAQEIKAAFPEAVSGEEVNGKYLGVSYNAIASIALQGVRELNDALKVVQSRVASMFAWFGPSGDMFNVKGNVCVDDVCVTKDQFKQMLINSGNTTTYTPSQSVPIVEDTTAASSTDPAGGVVESPQPAEESNTEPTAASGGSDTAVSSAEPAPTVTDSVVESAPADSGAATTE